jgi:hypothetical protein
LFFEKTNFKKLIKLKYRYYLPNINKKQKN